MSEDMREEFYDDCRACELVLKGSLEEIRENYRVEFDALLCEDCYIDYKSGGKDR